MLATHTSRMHPFSVHLTRAELSELLDEFADAVPFDPDELPQLANLRRKLTKLTGTKQGDRA
ncbi:hypothetical protein AB0I16_33270 [Streptomyces sp. NPDC050703]|uniref:hypothetical protein n=1 Tax=Streptomyces sp. NPDC050703 TaxID=3157218 RepID=UPI003426B5F4